MSEFSAIRNAVKATKAAEKTTAAAQKVGTRPYVVKIPDGTTIPFKAGTDVEKAKTWVKNFYSKDFETFVHSSTEEDGQLHELVSIRSKTPKPVERDEGTFSDFPAEVMTERSADQYRIRNTYVDPGYRGQGMGAGLYRQLFDLAKKEGRTVVSDSRLTPEAVAVWERLKELGYPIQSYPKIKTKDGFVRAGAESGTGEYRVGTDSWDRGADLPLYEYDPIMKERPGTLKPQAGQTAADKKGPKTDMFLEPQASGLELEVPGKGKKAIPVFIAPAGADEEERQRKLAEEQEPRMLEPLKIKKVEPGLYYDEDSEQYVKVDEDGNVTPVSLDEAR